MSAYGNIPDQFGYTWESFREMTDEEKSKINRDDAETADKYLTQGVITTAHVVRDLQEKGVYPIKAEYVDYVEERDGVVEGKTPADVDPDPDTDMKSGTDFGAGGDDLQKEALNGAQSKSLRETAADIKVGKLTARQGRAVIEMSFPTATEAQIKAITEVEVTLPVEPTTPEPDADQP